ncbi:MAG TPA: hypothetical protein VFG14_11510, partial [Chthoniobacteraceae bacterium]|nr:hypothetical protein [Chthoniobacteraceae bacterium]
HHAGDRIARDTREWGHGCGVNRGDASDATFAGGQVRMRRVKRMDAASTKDTGCGGIHHTTRARS